MSDSDDIVREFLVESAENLDRLDRNLVELEKHPDDWEMLADIFRAVHTIKGTSGFLAFGKLEAVTHAGESLLAALRDGQLGLNPEITTALLAMVDAVRRMLEAIRSGGTDGSTEYAELIARLKQLHAGGAAQVTDQRAAMARRAVPAAAPGEVEPATSAAEEAAEEINPVTSAARAADNCGETIALSKPSTPAGQNPAYRGDQCASTKQSFPAVTPIADALRMLHIAELSGGLPAEKKRSIPAIETPALQDQDADQASVKPGIVAAPDSQKAVSIPSEAHAPVVDEAKIRVRVPQLDRLMNLVGELVLVRNRIQQWIGCESDSALLSISQRLNLITTELQEGVMKTRLQPIGNIWSKFPRTVRDVAQGCGKQVRVELEGKESELRQNDYRSH